ncbi:MAG: thiamine pyrophosphate-binding protein, partial [Phycisphaerae bacterium]|nr:thiamine pyrophosphate-binding protein [Phycisphaerae bacterium]
MSKSSQGPRKSKKTTTPAATPDAPAKAAPSVPGSPRRSPSEPGSLAGKTGAEIFHEILLREGVDILFGFPGGMVLPIFDVLYRSPIKFILTRHAQGATHMADGYARSTGKTGVVIATSGPGATNLVTGLATANMDSVPLV